MDKNRINYTIDVLMAFFVFIVSTTGLIIFFFLPDGVRQGGYQEFLGVTKRTISGWHDWSGVILIVLIFFHFILHWNWLIITTKNLFKSKD